MDGKLMGVFFDCLFPQICSTECNFAGQLRLSPAGRGTGWRVTAPGRTTVSGKMG